MSGRFWATTASGVSGCYGAILGRSVTSIIVVKPTLEITGLLASIDSLGPLIDRLLTG